MSHLPLAAALAAGAVLSASAAAAATYNYEFLPSVAGPTVSTVTGSSDTGPLAASNPDIFTITAGYVTPFGLGQGFVTQTTSGLGVTYPGDTDPGHIDGSPLFTGEYLSVEFSYAVNLDNLTFFDMENGDDYTLWVRTTTGGFLTSSDLAFNEIDAANVTGFSVLAFGVPLVDGGLFGRGNDAFTLANFQISSVPLPAGAGLLLGALGLLGWARRRSA